MKSHWQAADLIGFGQLQQLQGPGPIFGAAQQRSALERMRWRENLQENHGFDQGGFRMIYLGF